MPPPPVVQVLHALPKGEESGLPPAKRESGPDGRRRHDLRQTGHQPHSTVSSFSMYSCGVGTKPFRLLLNTWMLLVLQ